VSGLEFRGNGRGKDEVGGFEWRMAADALAGKGSVLAVGSEIGTAPASPTPAFRGGVLLAVANHEFHLIEIRGEEQAGRFVFAGMPGDLGEHGTVRPWIDAMVGDGVDGDIVA